MARWVKLAYKGTTLDLDDGAAGASGNYSVMPDFVPPSLSRDVNYSYGSYSNRSGGTRVNDRPNDRVWSFGLRVKGASAAETHGMVRKVASFLENARDPNNGLYLEYCPNAAIPYQPIYGQQAIRYRIKAGSISIDQGYYVNVNVVDDVIICRLDLTIGPYAEGSKQSIMSGWGGLTTDTIGPGGLVITEGNTNKFNNPIFSNGTAGWSIGGSVSCQVNYNKDYILFGRDSVLLSSPGSVGQYYQAINVGNTNTHCLSFYAKKADSSAVTVADCYAYYGGSVATTYQAVGNGWYRCFGTVTGVASNTNSGAQLAANKAIYADMFQLEEDAYPTYPMYGDMPGCSWSSTAHGTASTTTRDTQQYSIDFYQDNSSRLSEITARIAVRWHHSNAHPNDRYLLSNFMDTYLKASDDKVYLGTVSSSAQTFNPQAIYIYYFVVSPSEQTIYINGVVDGTAGGISSTLNSAIKIGCADLGVTPGNFTLLDLTVWNHAAGSAQISADYTNLLQQINTGTYGQPVNLPPWSSRYVSGTVNNYSDSTHQDWMVFGNIPGDLPAETTLWIYDYGGAVKPLLLNLCDTVQPIQWGNLFSNISGTADAAALGGSAQVTALDTSEVAFPTTGAVTVTYNRDELVNKNLYLLASIKDAAAGTCYARAKITDSAGAWAAYSSPYNTISTGTVYTMHLSGPIEIPEVFDDYAWAGTASTFRIYWSMYRSAGTSNISFDYYRAMVGDVAYFPTGGTTTYYLIEDGKAKGYTSSAFVEVLEYRGDILELKPNRYNYLNIWRQGINAATDTTQVSLMTYAYVTPRWSIT